VGTFWVAAVVSSDNDISAVSKVMGHAGICIASDIYGSLLDMTAAEKFEWSAALISRQGQKATEPLTSK
jgi:hypothetical protein